MKFIRIKPDIPEKHVLVDENNFEVAKLKFFHNRLQLKKIDCLMEGELLYEVFFPGTINTFKTEEDRKYYKRAAKRAWESYWNTRSWEERSGLLDIHRHPRATAREDEIENVFPPGLGDAYRNVIMGRSPFRAVDYPPNSRIEVPDVDEIQPIRGGGGAAGGMGYGGGGGGFATAHITTGGTLTEETMRRAVDHLRQGLEGEPTISATLSSARSEIERRMRQSERDRANIQRSRDRLRGAYEAAVLSHNDRPEGSGAEIRGRAVSDSTDDEVTYITSIDGAI